MPTRPLPPHPIPATRKPRPADVARWVAAANAPAPSVYDVHTRRAWRRERDAALDMLSSWGLDANGQPKTAGK